MEYISDYSSEDSNSEYEEQKIQLIESDYSSEDSRSEDSNSEDSSEETTEKQYEDIQSFKLYEYICASIVASFYITTVASSIYDYVTLQTLNSNI